MENEKIFEMAQKLLSIGNELDQLDSTIGSMCVFLSDRTLRILEERVEKKEEQPKIQEEQSFPSCNTFEKKSSDKKENVPPKTVPEMLGIKNESGNPLLDKILNSSSEKSNSSPCDNNEECCGGGCCGGSGCDNDGDTSDPPSQNFKMDKTHSEFHNMPQESQQEIKSQIDNIAQKIRERLN